MKPRSLSDNIYPETTFTTVSYPLLVQNNQDEVETKCQNNSYFKIFGSDRTW